MHLVAIELENIRTFEGPHRIELSPGLNVLVGRNNVGKTTVLLAPLWAARWSQQWAAEARHAALSACVVLVLSIDEVELHDILGDAFSLGAERVDRVLGSAPWLLRIGWRLTQGQHPVPYLSIEGRQIDVRISIHPDAGERIHG